MKKSNIHCLDFGIIFLTNRFMQSRVPGFSVRVWKGPEKCNLDELDTNDIYPPVSSAASLCFFSLPLHYYLQVRTTPWSKHYAVRLDPCLLCQWTIRCLWNSKPWNTSYCLTSSFTSVRYFAILKLISSKK